MANRMNTIKGTVAKQTKNAATARSAKTPAGPTIGGVQGVGIATTPKRPQSAQSTKAVRAQHFGPTSGLGEEQILDEGTFTIPGVHELHEAKEDERTANRQLAQTVRQKLTNAYYKPVKQADDYFSHNANKTAADKPPMREEALNEVKVGDHVHLGFGKRGGAGHRGVVTKVAGTMVHIKQHDHDAVTNKYGPREFAGPITHVTVEKSVNENAPSMSVGNGAIVGVAPPDATVDFAAQKIKRVKKLGMVKRPKPKAE